MNYRALKNSQVRASAAVNTFANWQIRLLLTLLVLQMPYRTLLNLKEFIVYAKLKAIYEVQKEWRAKVTKILMEAFL